MIFLKQSTQIKVRVGPFVDVTDGFTPETGVALSTADEAELLKANGAATVSISAATWAAITGADGWYDLTLTTSHTDTVGELLVVVNDDSVCLPVFMRFQVVEEAVFDAMYAASAAGPLQSTTAGRTLDVTATGAAGIDWGNVENQSTSVDLSATAITLCDTITTYTGNTAQTGDSYALASGATGFTAIDTVVDAIKVKTDFLPSATAGAAGGVFIAGTNAATTITTSLTTTFTGNLTGSVGSVTGAVGSVTGAVGSVTGAVGSVIGSVGSVVGHTAQTGDTYALASGATGFTAIDTVVDTINVSTAGLAGAAMRGTDSAALASVCTEGRLAELDAANLPADIDTINTATGGLAGAAMRGTDSAALASVCTEGRLAELDAANIPADIDALPTAASVATSVLTTQMTESYAADGVAPTLAQAAFLISQALTEFAISSTTITVKKLDGTTSAATYTLDDATTPTSRTRAT